MSSCNAVILAGGFGTRLSENFPGITKPMVPIDGIPILERVINECKTYGYDDVLLVLHHLPDQIIEYFGDGKKFGISISYHIEPVPMGTAGALLQVLDLLADTFLVLYADVFTTVNLNYFAEFHKKKCADISLVVHPNDHPYDSDLILTDDKYRVLAFNAPPHNGPKILANLVNAALYLVNKSSLKKSVNFSGNFDIAQKLFPNLLENGVAIYAYNTKEYIKDMGTPDRRDRVERDLLSGVCNARSLDSQRNAIFIDRDGTINVEHGYVLKPSELQLIPRADSAIKNINQSKYLAICITNQPVVARGECSFETLNSIHNYLDVILGKKGAYIDSLYFCPHHPDDGFAGEITSLKKKCECRKPAPGLLLQAAKDLEIDLSNSWMIGDRTGDILAARRAGLFSAIVQTGAGGQDGRYDARPHFSGVDLANVVDFILQDYPVYKTQIESLVTQLENVKYIFISGPARSGKSTFTSLLQQRIKSENMQAHIIELDQFLLDDRTEDLSYLDRYDVDKILSLLNKTLDEKDFMIDDIGLNHHSGNLINYGSSKASSGDIYIIEGTTAFEIEKRFNKSNTLKVFIDASNAARKQRFETKYKSRDFTKSEINDLWNLRLSKEDYHIQSLRDKADVTITLIDTR